MSDITPTLTEKWEECPKCGEHRHGPHWNYDAQTCNICKQIIMKGPINITKSTTKIAYDWAVRSFGQEHVDNFPIRSLRIAEESIELAQAYNVPKEIIIDLVNIVYSRPAGDPYQEIGGIMMGITVLCAAMGVEPDEVFEAELRRVLSKSPSHFTKRNQDKIDLGLTVNKAPNRKREYK